MRRSALILVAVAAMLCAAAAAKFPLMSTISSTPGWKPEPATVKAARNLYDRYFAALDRGDLDAAWKERGGRNITEPQFRTLHSGARERWGKLRERRLLAVTYIKELPEGLPEPGLMIWFDYRVRYANSVRGCGRLTVHAPPDQPMRVWSEQMAVLTKAVQAEYRRQGGQALVDYAWTELEKNCPAEADLRQLGIQP